MSEVKRVPVKVKFSKEQMLDVLHDEIGEIISDSIVGRSRWSLMHELIFALEGKRYMASYFVAATEMQDERPWQDQETVECTEVESYEKVVQAYRPVLVDAP